MNVVETTEQLLALKVMRLTQPTLVSPQILTSENKDLPQGIFQQILQNDVTSVTGAETLAAGQFMLLPQSFGNIYLGETFSSYICVHNCANHPVEGVIVKADLQSNTTRISLPLNEQKSTPVTLKTDETLDDVIHYEVKEVGTHILVCEVNYITAAGFAQAFRKFFKFQVLKPLDVKTKFYNAETDELYVEAQIQNITSGPICLEKVELDSSEQYTVTSLNTLPNGESVFTAKNMLQPRNSCQFLYCIKPLPEISKDMAALRAANNIGKLDIVWRSNLGERGRLQTSQLQRNPIEYSDLRLIVTEAKNIVKIGEPFTFICRVSNTTERPVELNAKLDTKTRFGCDYTGSAEFNIGQIDAGKYKDFPLTVLPAKLGLIKISNLILSNVVLKKSYEFDNFAQVFVVDSDYREDEAFQMNKFVRYDATQAVN